MGQPFWNEGLTWARKAVELGAPQAASYYFGNLISDPNFRGQVPPLIKDAVAAGWSIDPLPNAPGALQQGDPATAVALINAAATPRPYPAAWEGLLRQAGGDLETLRRSAGNVADREVSALNAIAASESAIEARQTEVD